MATKPEKPLVSTGICTRCQQDLVLIDDVLGCPVCGAAVRVSAIHADLQARLSIAVGRTAHVSGDKGVGWGQRWSATSSQVVKPRRSMSLVEMWDYFNKQRK
jgi:hypothetical protein